MRRPLTVSLALTAFLLLPALSASAAPGGAGPSTDGAMSGYTGSFCAVRTDGHVICRGNQTVDEPGPFVMADSANYGGCGVLVSTSLSCWGQWGDHTTAIEPPGSTGWASIGIIGNSACGLRINGTLQCFGNGSAPSPPAGNTWTDIEGGGRAFCSRASDGDLECWQDFWDADPVAPPPGSFRDAYIGSYTACAVGDGFDLSCWGELVGDKPVPTDAFRQVTMDNDIGTGGLYHACGVRTDMTAKCWGSNNLGQRDAPGGVFMATAVTYFSSCGLRATGAYVCWGNPITGMPNGSFAPCTITGTTGKDTLTGTSGDDIICGLGDNDTLRGKGGNDWLLGDRGVDKLIAGGGNDVLSGGPHGDQLNGGPGRDYCVPDQDRRSCEKAA